MNKSIIGILGLVISLSLIFSGLLFLKNEKTEDYGQAVATGGNTINEEMIVIEEDKVPLAATIPSEADKAVEEEIAEEAEEAVVEEIAEETEEALVEEDAEETEEEIAEEVKIPQEPVAPSCLTEGNHHGVWTDCGDYRVMVCADCGQEISERAYRLTEGVYGYYRDDAAMQLFSKVNGVRRGFELNGTLHEVAKGRALACVGDFSHDNMSTLGECIAKGQEDAGTAVAEWNASEYHRDLLLDSLYTEGGSACLWYDSGNGNMKSVWVMVMN